MSEKVNLQDNKDKTTDDTNAAKTHNAVDEEHDIVQVSISESSELKNSSSSSSERKRNLPVWGLVVGIFFIVLLVGVWLWTRGNNAGTTTEKATTEKDKEGGHADESKEVKLESEALEAAGIEIEGVTQRPAVTLLKVTGAVENNQQQTQQVTPLVSGRVEKVNVVQGERVNAGVILAVISSPAVAEMHGKLREAETRLKTAERNLERVKRAENRVAVLQTKAKLDEAEANLRRTKRLVELGAGAGKDMITAETDYKTAKADYDFQSNITLNRELQEAQAEVDLANTEASHLRQSLQALGLTLTGRDDHTRNISLVALRAPASGIVTERMVNPGAGIEAGKPIFTISNISTVWVIANVPEIQLGNVREGTPAEIRSAALGTDIINGRVSYLDPQLNEETRTGRVRVEVPNPGERLKAGMFVEVGFQTSTGATTGEELMVPSTAVQRVGEETIVFIPKTDEPGAFEVREVELGGEVNGYHRVISGLKLGEKVVTKGSFTLKTQLQKGEMGEHGH